MPSFIHSLYTGIIYCYYDYYDYYDYYVYLGVQAGLALGRLHAYAVPVVLLMGMVERWWPPHCDDRGLWGGWGEGGGGVAMAMAHGWEACGVGRVGQEGV